MIGVLVSGEGTNLQALLDAGLPISAVASNVVGARALARARRATLPAAVFEVSDYARRVDRDAAMADWLAGRGVELVVCAGYMHLLTPEFLHRFPVVNVHPSLLPAFPGLHPIEDALAASVTETGVTIHYVDEGVDTGPIIAQEPVAVLPEDTPSTLRARIHAVEHRLLPDVIRLIVAGALGSPRPVATAPHDG
ncbi:MAG: phosphoribosylglycinamide formyltransferase [Actinomycetota bacterium]|nr:phosphoribosylglycinamide formyltransferase [Actinomycetota bacterium]